MAEVYELADRLSVLRDGEYVGELKRAEFSPDKVIEMMVGRRLEDFYERTRRAAGRVVLEVKNMSDGDRVKNACLQLREGEVLGLAGLVGAGRTELARLIFGADKRKSGEVFLDGIKLQIHQPQDAIRAGIGYVPEDRKLQGGGSGGLTGRSAGWSADRYDGCLRWTATFYRDAWYLHRDPRSRLPCGWRDHRDQQQNRLRVDREWVRWSGAMASDYRSLNHRRERVHSAQNHFRRARLRRRR